MKYIDEFDIDLVNQFLTFNTTEMHIQGTCDLFTTKPVGSDRKLYKVLDKMYNTEDNDEGESLKDMDSKQRQNSLNSVGSTEKSQSSPDNVNSQFIQLKNRSFSYSHTTKPQVLNNGDDATLKRSHSFASPTPETQIEHYEEDSPFGPLSQSSSRKLFGYLIGALNGTFPDHDFSTVQPKHFTMLHSAGELIAKVNSFLISSGKSTGLDWIWQTINTHMELDHCVCFQFDPSQSFLDDLGVIWCNMYFMFNKKKKRVAFLYFLATILNEADNSTTISRRRNSKRGTLDEEGMKMVEDDSEYDLRYNEDYEPIYEDVFEDDDIDMIDGTNTINKDEEGYDMSDDELANLNQDDEGYL